MIFFVRSRFRKRSDVGGGLPETSDVCNVTIKGILVGEVMRVWRPKIGSAAADVMVEGWKGDILSEDLRREQRRSFLIFNVIF